MTRVTAPLKVDSGESRVTVTFMEEPAVKSMGVEGVTETIENPGVVVCMLTTESGDAPEPAVKVKEYQNCSP